MFSKSHTGPLIQPRQNKYTHKTNRSRRINKWTCLIVYWWRRIFWRWPPLKSLCWNNAAEVAHLGASTVAAGTLFWSELSAASSSAPTTSDTTWAEEQEVDLLQVQICCWWFKGNSQPKNAVHTEYRYVPHTEVYLMFTLGYISDCWGKNVVKSLVLNHAVSQVHPALKTVTSCIKNQGPKPHNVTTDTTKQDHRGWSAAACMWNSTVWFSTLAGQRAIHITSVSSNLATRGSSSFNTKFFFLAE